MANNAHPHAKTHYWLATVSLGSVLLLGMAGYALARWMPMINVGERAASAFTWSDINRLYTVEQWIGEVLGDSSVSSRRDVLYNLAVAGLQKEWLERQNIRPNRARAVEVLEQRTVLKGLHRRIQSYLGDDFYRLYVEPVTMNTVFEAWYQQNESGRSAARRVHAEALKSGLSQVSQTYQLPQTEVLISDTETNRELVERLKTIDAPSGGAADAGEAGKDAIYDSVVDIGAAYMILPAQSAAAKEGQIAVQGVVFRKQPYPAFLQAVASAVPVEFGTFSLYDKADLQSRENSIF